MESKTEEEMRACQREGGNVHGLWGIVLVCGRRRAAAGPGAQRE
ncbi:hypothetical protein BER2_3189 [plant metagenome]|uniref:Uncharacterized protein n=1 Tax=plant metagenome TaxID=1297885 RepID=A0A484S8Q3_9ZZZZ